MPGEAAAQKKKQQQPGHTARTAAAQPRPSQQQRATATFEPYFWEAYNEIVRPERYDWYLIHRWLRDLGPDAFTLLKALRNLCYFNPREGTLRDTCQITVDELAELTGMKRSTVYRVLEGSEALRRFVQKQPEVIHIEGRTRRLPPRWRVCMDTPIHPDDMEAYDLLRAQREVGRAEDEEQKRKSQIEIYEKRKSQIDERKSQIDERKSQPGILTNKGSSLPSGLFTEEYLPPPETAVAAQARPAPQHKCCPPEGEGEGDALDPLAALWHQALVTLSQSVNIPTFEAHLKPLRPIRQEGDTITLAAPSAFTLEWILKRHEGHIREALSAVLGRPIAVQITLESK